MARSFEDDAKADFDAGSGTDFNLLAADTWTIFAWFRHGTPGGGNNVPLGIFEQSVDTNNRLQLGFNTIAIADARGTIQFAYVGDTGTFINRTVTQYEDSIWHWLMFVKYADDDQKVYVDGIEKGSNTLSVTAGTGTLINSRWGRSDLFFGEAFNNSFSEFHEEETNGLARCAGWVDTALTVDEGEAFAFQGIIPRGIMPNIWNEFAGGSGSSPEPDWSGHNNDATLTGTTVIEHPPIGMPFGVVRTDSKNGPPPNFPSYVNPPRIIKV